MWLGKLQNAMAFAMLLCYTWLYFSRADNNYLVLLAIPLFLFVFMPLIYQGDGDRFKISDAVGGVIALLMLLYAFLVHS